MNVKHWIQGWRRDIAGVRVKGSFARNALYTFSDAAVNVLSQIILTPIVAHLYGPVAYGIYGLFNTISTNLSTIAGLGYPGAFMLPREERDFHALARLSLLLLITITAITLPFFLIPSLLYTAFPSWRVMGRWCIAIPLMVLVLGGFQILLHWATRVKAFSLYAKVGPTTNVSLRMMNVAIGVVHRGSSFGLIFSDVFVRTLSGIWFALGLRKHGLGRILIRQQRRAVRDAAIDYRDYPTFIFPGRWLGLFALQLPIFGLTALGDVDSGAVGRFTLAGGLLLMPLRLFGYSLSAVFMQKANEAGQNDPASLGLLTRRLYMRLFALGVIPFTALTFFGDKVFLLIGDTWQVAGAYCGIMGPFYLFRLLSEPLITIYNAQRAEKRLFVFYVFLFALNAAAVWIGTYVFADAAMVVLLFAGCNTAAYLYLSCAILRTTGLPWQRITARTLLLTLLSAAVLAALRFAVFGSWLPVMR